MPALIIHGHFYQPPRENPWTDLVEEQPSAAPFHDWNERIHSECYQPNAFVAAADPVTGEPAFTNNYESISFNFGPTLLSWLEKNHPQTYQQIVAADRASALRHDGHGNAFSQAYGHAILSLCNERDLRTQIRWGLADFRYRFGREPEAMWLPETACNDHVLDALIEEGLQFVVLAPNQAAQVRVRIPTSRDSDRVNVEWQTVNEHAIDTSISYARYHTDGSNRSLAVFFYDGATSRAIAFEKLLTSSRTFADRLVQAVGNRHMVNVATDGETYGHHFKFGDLCLAHLVGGEAPARGFQLTNYGAYLAAHPPQFEVQLNNGLLAEGTSWSCVHGVGRWIRDCGCQTGGETGWNQSWRTPLRKALDYLRDENVNYFEGTRGNLFVYPWLARDESISLILNPYHSREEFVNQQAGRSLSRDETWRALMYLELQRMLLLMYTSCGWFFNDISGLETIQILKYAARALDLMNQLELPSARERFLEILSEAKSNRQWLGTGADIFRKFVEPVKSARPEEPIPA